MISDMSSWLKSVSQQVLSAGGGGKRDSSLFANKPPETIRRGKRLTVQSDVVHGQDDGSVGLGDPLHRAVDSSVRSLHIVLLWVQRKAIYTPYTKIMRNNASTSLLSISNYFPRAKGTERAPQSLKSDKVERTL